MFIEKLMLINFRNYKEVDITFNKNKNIIYGYNAQGKTNILEALYFIACARSHRTKKEKELIKWDQNQCFIKTLVNKSYSDIEIDVKLSEDQKKEIKINNTPIKKIGELLGNLNAIMFSPEDIKLIKEGPSERRRFIDITNSQLKPNYFFNLQKYFKTINHRNVLLKDTKNNDKFMDVLQIWNNNLIEIGSKIMYYRNEYLNKISKYVKDIHKKISDEEIDIKYMPSVKTDDLWDIEDLKKNYSESLNKSIEKDIYNNTTSIGPHRDNFEIFVNNINTRIYGSQGQQRTVALSLKLAEVELFKDELGEYPILLLDDVMSELDDKRQQFVLDYLKNTQVFITCTNKDKFSSDASFFNVYDGCLRKE